MVIEPNTPIELKSKLSKRSVILFGAGGLGLKIAKYCSSTDIEIVGFADSHATGMVEGYEIYSPQKLVEEFPDAHIIISSNIFHDEIKNKLLDLGFSEQQLFSYKLFIKNEITWNDLEKTASWNRMKIRVKEISTWIDEHDNSVIDYGAGEMFLKTLLANNVKYTPIDYIKRNEETMLVDLNDGLFPDIQSDVTVLSGILEFLTSTNKLLEHVCKRTKRKLILSYMTLDKFSNINDRRASAYINDYTEKDLIEKIEKHGFTLKVKRIDPSHHVNTLYLFNKS